MSELDERLTNVLERVESLPAVGRVAALVGALVLFVVAQRLAQVSADTIETTPTVALAALVALVTMVVSAAVLALVAGSFGLELRERGLL